jgi:flagellar biosynthesis/type III secretory pathway M-ring protein FliF/YscJ
MGAVRLLYGVFGLVALIVVAAVAPGLFVIVAGCLAWAVAFDIAVAVRTSAEAQQRSAELLARMLEMQEVEEVRRRQRDAEAERSKRATVAPPPAADWSVVEAEVNSLAARPTGRPTPPPTLR